MSHAGPHGTQIMPPHDGFTAADRAVLMSVHRHVTGGSEWEDGLLNRMDRVEQTQLRATWWGRTALGAAVVAVVGSMWALITGRQIP